MLVRIGRVAAIAVVVPTFVVLFVRDGFRSDNLFLVPDLLLCALLVFGAVAPSRLARPVLTFGFGFAGGVLTTAVFSYVARGALGEGIPTLVAAVACVVMAGLLGSKTARQPAG